MAAQVLVVAERALVAAYELLLVTCGTWFPDQGWNLGPLHWELGVLATGPLWESFPLFFLILI